MERHKENSMGVCVCARARLRDRIQFQRRISDERCIGSLDTAHIHTRARAHILSVNVRKRAAALKIHIIFSSVWILRPPRFLAHESRAVAVAFGACTSHASTVERPLMFFRCSRAHGSNTERVSTELAFLFCFNFCCMESE